MTICPSPTELRSLLADELPASEAAAIDSHAQNCQECRRVLEELCDADGTEDWQKWWRNGNTSVTGAQLLDDLDRYRCKAVLGSGSFGTVYRCYDEILHEDVAIKIPHHHRVSTIQDVDDYLEEARNWARLDHPGIARFLHADRAGGSCYVVSKFIDGCSLKDRIRQSRLSPVEAASIIAQVAEALHHVHLQRLYHRDIKPSNILLNQHGRPFLTDFGLALREEEIGSGPRAPGSLPYMSPEQARGEGHLVDGRTDIYSLGVVFYELLAGQRPFRGSSDAQLARQIVTRAAPPLRAIDEEVDVPKELERICLKALSKRLSDRYMTARDFAEDIQYWLKNQEQRAERRTKIVPKGLGSFDANDSYFFLELLPGPRDRNGLPESIRSWKTRIEQTDPEETFRVGLISGPSGCGKSSLIKAGLLPRLDRNIVSIYIAADTRDTESRLLGRLRRSCPDLSPELNLVESVTAIRTGRATEPNVKVLVVIDQFEQWLHTSGNRPNSVLINALRQCDGQRIQAILSVRDDFHTAVGRRMDELEVRLIQGVTFERVDLFDLKHARSVLVELGRAYGRLPEDLRNLTAAHERFLDKAVNECAEDGTVAPVRLALFAHMVRNKDWHPNTVEDLGGLAGIGTMFLEEAFSPKNPYHGCHHEAAQETLKVLLPDLGTDISTQVRTREQLQKASGISDAGEFNSLMNTLETELRLISPTDSESVQAEDEISIAVPPDRKLYQLTHDFLVPSLREWLTRKQRETRHGRAELALSGRSALWIGMPETKQLPSMGEWLSIHLLVKRTRWTAAQQKMMAQANKLYLFRGLWMALAVAAIGLGVWGVVYRSDQITRRHVAKATRAWRDAQEDVALWELSQALRRDREHAAVQELVSEMQNEGGATFHIQPAHCAVNVVPDPDADRQMNLEWNPRVLSGKGPRFRSGEHIRLTVGHYRVAVEDSSNRVSIRFPLFIDRRSHDLLTNTTQAATPQSPDDSLTIDLAQHIGVDLVVPSEIPPEFAYVNPGPMWRSADPRGLSAEESRMASGATVAREEEVEVRIHDGSSQDLLIGDTIDEGFLIAKAETTWGDFRRWWGDGEQGLGAQFCSWQLERITRISEVTAETMHVPLEVKRQCWSAVLKDLNIDPVSLDDEQLLATAFSDLRAVRESAWQEFKKKIDLHLSGLSSSDDALPAHLGWHTAVAFARTHAPLNIGQFRSWVATRIRDAVEYASKLKQLQTDLIARTDPYVARDELPDHPLVRDLLSPIEVHEYPRPVFVAYDYWLKVRTFYGWQVPIEEVLAVAATDDSRTRESLPQLEPTTWLWRREAGATTIRNPIWPPRSSVDFYADAISAGRVEPLREHLVRWLTWMISLEQSEEAVYTDLLAQLDATSDTDPANIPFAVRYRYGMHQGWDIPNWKEWQKAFRGADARPFPWGAGGGSAWVENRPGVLPEQSAYSMLSDVSPYGVFHMRGNVSEWVRVSDDLMTPLELNDGNTVVVPSPKAWEGCFPRRVFLMGGNYQMESRFADSRSALSLSGRRAPPGGRQTAWTGLRIIRRIHGQDRSG